MGTHSLESLILNLGVRCLTLSRCFVLSFMLSKHDFAFYFLACVGEGSQVTLF